MNLYFSKIITKSSFRIVINCIIHESSNLKLTKKEKKSLPRVIRPYFSSQYSFRDFTNLSSDLFYSFKTVYKVLFQDHYQLPLILSMAWNLLLLFNGNMIKSCQKLGCILIWLSYKTQPKTLLMYLSCDYEDDSMMWPSQLCMHFAIWWCWFSCSCSFVGLVKVLQTMRWCHKEKRKN